MLNGPVVVWANVNVVNHYFKTKGAYHETIH